MADTQHNAENYNVPFHPSCQWSIGLFTNRAGDRSHAITLDVGRNHYIFPGSPDGARAHFSKMGFAVPDDIVDRYRRLYKNRGPVDPRATMFNANDKAKAELESAVHQQKETAAMRKEAEASAPATGDSFGVEPIDLKPFPRQDANGKWL